MFEEEAGELEGERFWRGRSGELLGDVVDLARLFGLKCVFH